MKTKIYTCLFLSFVAASAFAGDTNVKPRDYEVTIKTSTSILVQGPIAAMPGSMASVSSMESQVYVVGCDPSSTAASMTTATLQTGKAIYLTPDENLSSDTVEFQWQLDQLEKMGKLRSGACEVDLPSVTGQSGRQVINLPAGKSFATTSGQYEIVLKRIN
ncbi:hypothetical protein [Janthinobacterium sp. MDT1-19]|uniref:hypothetical protein n=1 Tax=Janthinobacterium sp. MDT1-19 TaxID=1259339 RepID=UPI003F1F9FDA